jgi:hypothetical protein
MSPRVLAAAVLALALAGCGKMGALERPGPLFGSRTAGEEPAGRTAPPPVTTVDPRDPDRSTDLAPIRVLPVPGSGQDPFGAPPQGALPSAHNYPQ